MKIGGYLSQVVRMKFKFQSWINLCCDIHIVSATTRVTAISHVDLKKMLSQEG